MTGPSRPGLADGTTSLDAAADEMVPVLDGRAGFRESSVVHFPAPASRLRAARYAATSATRSVEGDPARSAEVSARLGAQYAALSAAETGGAGAPMGVSGQAE